MKASSYHPELWEDWIIDKVMWVQLSVVMVDLLLIAALCELAVVAWRWAEERSVMQLVWALANVACVALLAAAFHVRHPTAMMSLVWIACLFMGASTCALGWKWWKGVGR